MIGFAPAKVNLGLFVTGKRPDGFHDLESVFWPLAWHDVLEVFKSSEPGLQLVTSGLEIPGSLESNLVQRAYDVMQSAYGIGGVRVHLHKVIPMGAGLGGGSSDATCMLRLLNELFELHLSDAEGLQLAAQLGSDCPFFWHAKPALVTGRGERLQSIDVPTVRGRYVTVLHPGIHVSTREAFAHIEPKTSDIKWSEWGQEIAVTDWHTVLRNDFEAGVVRQHPEIARALNCLMESGAHYAQMTGTGSACFGVFELETEALGAFARAIECGWIGFSGSL